MKRQFGFLTGALALCLVFNVSAETLRREGGDTGQRAQLMLRQLSQAKASLEADNAKLSAEVQDLKDQLAKAEQQLGHAGKSLHKSKASNDRLVTRVREDNKKLLALMDRYRDSVQLLRMEKANVEHLKLAVEERNTWIDKCKANNEAMYQFNLKLVERYQHKGLWQELTQAEPFTGIGDVKVETLAQEYRYKLEDLQVARFKSQPPAARPN